MYYIYTYKSTGYSYSNIYYNRIPQLSNLLDHQETEGQHVSDCALCQLSTFKYDILGSLSPEIVVEIIQLLNDVKTVILLQRVCVISYIYICLTYSRSSTDNKSQGLKKMAYSIILSSCLFHSSETYAYRFTF